MSILKVKGEIRQKQIRKAALQVIVEEDLNMLTIESIALIVGVTKSNIYRHYSCKNDIVEDIMRKINSDLQKMILDSAKIDLPIERLKHIFLNHILLLEKSKGAPILIFTNKSYMKSSTLKTIMNETIKNYLKSVMGILQSGIDDGSFRSSLNVRHAALTYLGIIQSIILQWLTSNGSFSPQKRGKEAWTVFMNGLCQK